MLSDSKIEQIYKILVDYHSRYLKQYDVKLPSLKDKRGNYTKNALVLIYLAQDYPDTRNISKQELTDFIRGYYPQTADVQQARHLGMQSGWSIVSGTRGNSHISHGYYQLKSLKKPHPAFRAQRRTGISNDDFQIIKKKYDNRCATCGSKEGKAIYQYTGVKTKLMAAHMNPNKSQISGNIIPQCQMCNRAYRNWWAFDNRGRVISVSNPQVILQSSEEVQLEIYKLLKKKFSAQNK